MALTLPRWIAAIVAGCLILVAWFLTPRTREPRPADQRTLLVRRENGAGQRASEAILRLRALELRDSVRAVTGRLPQSDTSRFLVSNALPASARKVGGVMAARAALQRVRPAASPVDIALVLDTASTVRGHPVSSSIIRIDHALPPVSGGRCLVIGRIGLRQSGWGERYWSSYLTGADVAARLLGACGFYEAFGAPGPEIDRWLTRGAWRFGLAGAAPSRRQPWQRDYDSWEPSGFGAVSLARYLLTSRGYRCATGDEDACRQLVLEPNSDRAARVLLRVGADRILANTRDFGWWWARPLGPREPMMLASMAQGIGVDQFRRFWTSDKPPAEAFASATGQDIGAWTSAWASGAYGQPKRGPGINSSAAAWAALLAILGLSGAIVSSRRRQVA